MKSTIEAKLDMKKSKIFSKFFFISVQYQMAVDMRQKL